MDVDLVVEATQYAEYHQFCERLRERGYTQGQEPEDPICRWRQHELVVDIMPLDQEVLGFSNRWYRSAYQTRQPLYLGDDLLIHHIDAPHFLATKWAAFQSRGKGDYVMSHDLEDFVRVVDGRPEIDVELQASTPELQGAVRGGIKNLLEDRFFIEALPGHFPDSERRASVLVERLRGIASA